ncbi:MAG: formylglycine-generating enzyme family protein [Bacteroidales bacterium]|nr:formylglycine-generating enzyme family protein [Bacteroidales bacterium]
MKIVKQYVSIALALVLMLMSCQRNTGYGQLTGAPNRNRTVVPMPHGMVYIPAGFFTMGAGSDDPSFSFTYSPRVVSISGFYMDETEITNNQYRQFVNWVRDSIRLRLLAEVDPIFIIEDPNDDFDIPRLNWSARPRRWTPEMQEAVEQLYIPQEERFMRRRELDTRLLNFEFYTFDYMAAARRSEGEIDPRFEGVHMGSFQTRPASTRSRAGFVRRHVVNVYPDTLAWLVDFAYSYNDPMVRSYFSSPMFDHYPVVGVNWHQARAFARWRTITHQNELARRGLPMLEEYRLPTEAEWEFAARGGLEFNPFPWGGPYALNINGCFIGNFKPQRGKYSLDGGILPMIVGHFPPNDFGLFDMMGNVAEWCIDAWQDSYQGLHDFNPVFLFDASPDDPPARKRKVIRGGSFKDFAENTKVYARHYEYQDTAKSYIGFRTVMSHLGSGRTEQSRTRSNVHRR